jgi:hypothetical protein
MWKCDDYDEEGFIACEEAYYEAMDRAYDQFKDDMCTESYEDNCAHYGKAFVDAFLAKQSHP